MQVSQTSDTRERERGSEAGDWKEPSKESQGEQRPPAPLFHPILLGNSPAPSTTRRTQNVYSLVKLD